MKFGYARVSTMEQDLNLQIDALTQAGCKEIITDEISGSTIDRTGLNKLLERLRDSDELVVWRLDRLGRSVRHLIELINTFDKKGISFHSLTEHIDTSTNSGRLIFNIFASLAEFERYLIKERTIAGLNAARARGRLGGRKPKDKAKIDIAIELYHKRELSVEQICKAVGISRGTIYKYLR